MSFRNMQRKVVRLQPLMADLFRLLQLPQDTKVVDVILNERDMRDIRLLVELPYGHEQGRVEQHVGGNP